MVCVDWLYLVDDFVVGDVCNCVGVFGVWLVDESGLFVVYWNWFR